MENSDCSQGGKPTDSAGERQPYLWGKLHKGPAGEVEAWLPLADHCTDVAFVFLALCRTNAAHRALSQAIGHAPTPVHLERLAALAFLHDIGKCNHGFQAKARREPRDTAGHVHEISALLYDPDLQKRLLDSLGFDEIASWFDDAEGTLGMLLASISHHGKPIKLDHTETNRYRRYWLPRDGIDPLEDLTNLTLTVRQAFPQAFTGDASPLSPTPELQHRFAGLVMLADWIGSHEGFFPFRHGPECRAAFAQRAASEAITTIGLNSQPFRSRLDPRAGFTDLFPGFSPTALQAALMDPPNVPVMIAESDTGSGKTEAALACFFQLFARGEVDSLYFALPTRVAARELYERILLFVKEVFRDNAPPVLLAVPGYAKVDGEQALPSEDNLWQDDETLRRRERAWAAERPKRFLAAPIAVGTVDQALMATMQVNHAHLRAVCLERSLLVVDEVHASDTYMRGLLRALLDHHTRSGARALLLSATLSADAREAFLTPQSAVPVVPSFSEAIQSPYPALTGSGSAPTPIGGVGTRQKAVQLEPAPYLAEPKALQPRVAEALRAGARVLVVLNTVARAIDFLRAAEADPVVARTLFCVNNQTCPHHGRFARADRLILDREVSRVFGKGSPDGALLLVGTQTLEQSLDIDADWLITDLCPMDVLLQRIGRLHRHTRRRPPGFDTPTCTVLMPAEPSLEAWFDAKGRLHGLAGLGRVYPDLRIAQLTIERIGAGCTIRIPDDNRELIETTVHPERLARFTGPPWDGHQQQLLGTATAHGLAARTALMPWHQPFGPELRFGDFDERLATRLGLEDRRLSLDPPITSPFGQTLHELPVPGWMAGDTDATAPEAAPDATRDVVTFRYGGRDYRYTRFGLELDR
ncbi:CRISPR-associated helicase/endonuclease Cas3 [Alkalilimnicola ehrlichii MLHE-1]|uniref:CRISPR-associated helicase, Cas3 family n=1 Tax=Alkalilimnicola ehrlichii (strain ATCC BAA-1101 / DSM 17681 / MLHE-1) TaxID=187272 RepID=Q0AA29_ALKEH|nr:CRISPR-associated helicase/endonuclease Cas3 [Alkalilimnicola ehrlichii]ABI56308.1 CRISPR-associated helicase, Cas3 family [Alkalilimnicola ehrlichii MLHE-1]